MQRVAVIDIGSNTPRLVIYEVESGHFKRVVSHRERLELMNRIENGALSAVGAEELLAFLEEAVKMSAISGCGRPNCFGTAALRSVENPGQLISLLKKETGLELVILTAEQEAYYEFRGLMSQRELSEGIGLDLGGGSAQLFDFKDGQFGSYISPAVGCLYLYENFVDGILPREGQIKRMRSYIRAQLRPGRFARKSGHERLYVMGGTARMMAKLDLRLREAEAHVGGYVLSARRVGELVETLRAMKGDALRFIHCVGSERLHTVLPGMIAIEEIVNFVGASELQVAKVGVREGYLESVVLQREPLYHREP